MPSQGKTKRLSREDRELLEVAYQRIHQIPNEVSDHEKVIEFLKKEQVAWEMVCAKTTHCKRCLGSGREFDGTRSCYACKGSGKP